MSALSAVAVLAGPAMAAAQHSDHHAPPLTDEDRVAAFPDLGGMDARGMMPENPFNTFLLVDRLEARRAGGGNVSSWQAKAWAGRDFNRLWLRSEGERRSGHTEQAEVELLYGRVVGAWWDLVAGVRHDVRPGPSQTWAAIGLQGIAPYHFEIEATAFVGEGGQAAVRFEIEYELLMTQRLVLQPSLELNAYAEDDVGRGIGSGLATAEAGLRLRYEIRREIAPYVGFVREQSFGGTADLVRAGGGDTGDTRLVAGIRVWF